MPHHDLQRGEDADQIKVIWPEAWFIIAALFNTKGETRRHLDSLH
jgi:hypothetical protein